MTWGTLSTPAKVVILLLGLAALMLATHALSQDKKPQEFKPTDMQMLELQVAQKDAIIARKDLDAAQAAYQRALAVLSQKSNDVKRDNKWPEKVEFDPNTLSYSLKEAPKEAPKP